jgi:hypothetical protein
MSIVIQQSQQTSFANLINDVYTLTNRPDRVAETALAVQGAILWAHHTDYYYKDLVEAPIEFQGLAYLQQVPLAQFPNFRSLKYIRKYYPGTGPNNPPTQDQSPNNLPPLYGMYYDPGANLPDGRFFKIITPEEVLDSYHVNKIDVAYIAGQTIQIRSGDYFQYCLCGYYAHPTVANSQTNSWIANEFPLAIVYKAASVVFKTIGFDEQNQQYQQLAIEEASMIQMSNIQVEGY